MSGAGRSSRLQWVLVPPPAMPPRALSRCHSPPARLCVHRLVFPASRARAVLVNRAADDTFIPRAAGGVNLWLPVPPGRGGTGARTPHGRPPPGVPPGQAAQEPGSAQGGWALSGAGWVGGCQSAHLSPPPVTQAGRRGRSLGRGLSPLLPGWWEVRQAAGTLGEGGNPMGPPPPAPSKDGETEARGGTGPQDPDPTAQGSRCSPLPPRTVPVLTSLWAGGDRRSRAPLGCRGGGAGGCLSVHPSVVCVRAGPPGDLLWALALTALAPSSPLPPACQDERWWWPPPHPPHPSRQPQAGSRSLAADTVCFPAWEPTPSQAISLGAPHPCGPARGSRVPGRTGLQLPGTDTHGTAPPQPLTRTPSPVGRTQSGCSESEAGLTGTLGGLVAVPAHTPAPSPLGHWPPPLSRLWSCPLLPGAALEPPAP